MGEPAGQNQLVECNSRRSRYIQAAVHSPLICDTIISYIKFGNGMILLTLRSIHVAA